MTDDVAHHDPMATGSEAFQQQVRDSCRRATELADLLESGNDPRVLRQVRRAWIEAELPSHCPEAWARLWTAVQRSADPSRVMSGRDSRRLRALKDPVTVYRGARAGGERGWSWTLRRAVALDFALRYSACEDGSDHARLCVARVRTVDIIAYFTWGGEDEVIIDPHNIDWATTLITSP